MTDSPNLAMPFIEGGELLPDVTLNEALRLIDTLVQLAIVDRDLNAPPGSPSEGQRWIVKASPSPTGAWAGHGNQVAAWQDGGWLFAVPKVGWFAYLIDESALVAWSGTAWVNALDVSGITTLQNLALLGVGTTADSTNPLSAKLNNALWTAKTAAEGGDGNLRYKMSKESAANTLSLLLQDNFSGRAEIGLTGDDDLHVKVSSDGSTWLEALVVDRTTGGVRFRAAETNVASASTCDIGAAAALKVAITGTTTITSFGTAPHALRLIKFAGALTLTHNATSLVLPGAANIATAANDRAIAVSDGSGNWYVVAYQRANGKPVIAPAAADVSDSTSTGRALLTAADTPSARAAIYAAPFDALAFNGMQVNGNVDVAQELGTTGATLASGTAKYIADCIEAQYVHGAGTAVVTSAQLAAASFPSALPGYSFGHQLKATTALSSPANGDYALHRWHIEGYRVARLGWGAAGAQPLAYAFQFYSTASGTAFVKFSNSDKSRNYYKEITVAAGWNFFSGTITGDTSGTWDKSNGNGLIIEVFSAGKAASPVAPGAWTSTNTTQTTSSTNLLGTNNNLTIMTGLIVLPGIELPSSDRAPLIMRPFDQELTLCRRYWEASYDYGTPPGAGTTAGWCNLYLPAAAGTGEAHLSVRYQVPKRASSTVTLYDNVGTAGKVYKGAAGKTAVVDNAGLNSFRGGTTDATSAVELGFQFVSDARL